MKKVFLISSLVMMSMIISSCTNTKKQTDETAETDTTEMTNDELITLFDGQTFDGWRGYGRV